MLPLLATIFVASLLGSLHCAGMCGAFVTIACGGERPAHSQASYHGGRLLTYLAMGVAAGSLGAVVDLGSTTAGLRPVAAVISGAIMVLWGLLALLRAGGARVGKLEPPAKMQALLVRGNQVAGRYGPTGRAGLIGLLTTLLPCGWLYAFVAVAGGTASPLGGALVMLTFWLGTLPVLVSLGLGTRTLLGRLAPRLPVLTSVVIVAAGLWTLFGRLSLDGVAMASAASATTQPAQLDEVEPSCCHPR